MEIKPQSYLDQHALFHFERSRLNNLFMEAVKCPLVLVCAGAGYGKTSAVHDFSLRYQADTMWIQLSERDNVGSRFWENFTRTIAHHYEPLAKAMKKLGFPDNIDKRNQDLALIRSHMKLERRIIVMDDFHFIENPAIIRYMEHVTNNVLPGTSLFLISRSTPRINTASLFSRGKVFSVSENDLRFSEDEIAQFFRQLDIPLKADSLREVMQDTGGWSFAINLIARSYKKAPGYGGYLRSAMKTNIFKLMETEIWDEISKHLQNFLVRLSLVGHLSVDLIELLAGGNKDLLAEMERQSAYVRYDSYINAYLIHPLFLEFLTTKQELLSEEHKKETYAIAGEWCRTNGFKIDALSYFEKVGDYKSIAGIFIGSQSQIPFDIASFTAAIFQRAPIEVFDTVPYLASIHMRTIMSQGLWEDAIRLAEYYEARYIELPMDEQFRRLTLSSIYYCWGFSHASMCLTTDAYDFDIYYERLDKRCSKRFDPGVLINKNPGGPWICSVGSSKKGAPKKYLDALKRSLAYLSHCDICFGSGEYDLACAELMFYMNDTGAAETYIVQALEIARKMRQSEFVHRALFYKLRIAVSQGNYAKAEQALKDMKVNLEDPEYFNRYVDYDITLCWYYCALGLPEKIPDWLKDNFSFYAHASFIENFANQMKARYFYMTRNYSPLLSFINDMKQRESYLFGRVEMLAIKACVLYKMKNKKGACTALEEAYNTASPNEILMPFIELGKDMRTLTAFILKESSGVPSFCGIPGSWLENVNRKAATYSKYQAHVIAEYKQASGMTDAIIITPREHEILTDLTRGLTRREIASLHGLSINTVKTVINNIHSKMGAENMPDLIRLAVEKKLI